MIDYKVMEAVQDSWGCLVCKKCKDKYCSYLNKDGKQVICVDFISAAYFPEDDDFRVRCAKEGGN